MKPELFQLANYSKPQYVEKSASSLTMTALFSCEEVKPIPITFRLKSRLDNIDRVRVTAKMGGHHISIQEGYEDDFYDLAMKLDNLLTLQRENSRQRAETTLHRLLEMETT